MSAGCTPLPAGNLVTNGELIFDETTCLTWMKTNATNHPYADAEAYCETLELGGYDDFRLPTAGEAATLFECPLAYPDLLRPGFVAVGDGIWTSTLSGTVAGDQPKVCGAGQSSGAYYDFGKVGGQNTRCVRGESTVPDRTDCKTNTAICSP